MHPTHLEFDDLLSEILGERIPGRPKQEPFQETVIQNYKIGSRLRYGKATWHYCQAGPVGQTSPERGMGSLVVPETLATIGATPVGSRSVVINDTDLDHGIGYWANGKVEIWTAGTSQHRIIKSSTASNGTSVTITLYHPTTVLAATGTGLEICQSLYAQVDSMTAHAHAGFLTVAGIPLMLITAEYFFWAQTWGICSPAAYVGDMGETTGSRTVYWYVDGTIQCEEEGAWVAGRQKAGVLIPDTAPGGAGTGQTVVMLQMDP